MDQVARESKPAVRTTRPNKVTASGPLTGADRNLKLINQVGRDQSPEQHDSDDTGHRQWQAAGTRTDLGLSWQVKSLSLPTRKDAGPYWAWARD
jgi:hypothetical protein